MNLAVKTLLPVLVVLALTGCMHLPADVAGELSAPDGVRPNNFARIDGEKAVSSGGRRCRHEADTGTPPAQAGC